MGGLVARREGFAGVVSLDLIRFDRLLAVDTESMTATLEPGLRGPAAEALLAEHGLTLGHFPQSFEYASIGGFAVTRSSGQSSAGYGRFDSLVVGLRVATPQGELVLGNSPANAAGPDLREVVMGSEGAFGVVTAVTVRVRHVPVVKVYESWRWDSFVDGAAAMRTLAQAGVLPTVLRLSDENETQINLAKPAEVGGESGGGCLMVTGFEGTQEAVDAKRTAVTALLTGLGGTSLGEDEGWSSGRFHGPYLRDSLLDVGRAGRDPGDGHLLVQPPPGVRRGEGGAHLHARRGHARALPHLARLRDRRLALLHRRREAVGRPDRAVAGRQGRRVRRDDRQRRLDHPPPRRRPGPQAVAGPRDRPGRRADAARAQGRSSTRPGC